MSSEGSKLEFGPSGASNPGFADFGEWRQESAEAKTARIVPDQSMVGPVQLSTMRGQAPLMLPKCRVSLGNSGAAGAGQTGWLAWFR